MNNSKVITKDSQETEKLGKQFAQQLKGGDVMCLYGNLGAGKTTFVKGVAEGLGIKTRIVSPTFVIIREHDIVHHPTIKRLYHLDLYRLEEARDITGIDLSELLQEKTAVTIIEWPKIALSILPKQRWDIVFTPQDASRIITMTHLG